VVVGGPLRHVDNLNILVYVNGINIRREEAWVESVQESDRWAVITGASSGLGAVFAERLARRGLVLLLTGRDVGRLAAVRRRVGRDVPGARIEVVVADLATADGVAVVVEEVAGRDVELLVNNAGFGTYGRFGDVPSGREAGVVAVDVAAVVQLTHALLPPMIERGRGGVINVASTISFQPAPYQAVYGASKAFVLSFSQALWEETRSVTVTALCPGATRTGFVDALESDVSSTSVYRRLAEPGPVDDAGLRAFDRARRVAVPGMGNRFTSVAGRLLPRALLTRVTGRMLASPSTELARHRPAEASHAR
jgi:short-subunit dehydrogenase